MEYTRKIVNVFGCDIVGVFVWEVSKLMAHTLKEGKTGKELLKGLPVFILSGLLLIMFIKAPQYLLPSKIVVQQSQEREFLLCHKKIVF